MFNIIPFVKRRSRLLKYMNEKGGGIAIIPNAPRKLRNKDIYYPYRHDSDFYYLTGFVDPESCLVLIAGKNNRSFLFCREINSFEEVWEGPSYNPSQAMDLFNFDEAYPIEDLNRLIPVLMLGQKSLYIKLVSDRENFNKFYDWITASKKQNRVGLDIPTSLQDLQPILAEMRVIKDISEINTIRKAAKISATAHTHAILACRVGMYEYELEAELLYTLHRLGAISTAYDTIVAAGKNSCTMHHKTGRSILNDGDLVLIDAGCEFNSYASDITRTFPINGRYSPTQRALYDIILAAQFAAINAITPSCTFDLIHESAIKIIIQGLLDERILRGDLDNIMESGYYNRFYIHRTNHWLGLDVHDVGNYPNRKLENGMIMAIEPGLYIRPAEDIPERFWNIGIRIEDDILINETGYELITEDVPKDPDEIEKLMQNLN